MIVSSEYVVTLYHSTNCICLVFHALSMEICNNTIIKLLLKWNSLSQRISHQLKHSTIHLRLMLRRIQTPINQSIVRHIISLDSLLLHLTKYLNGSTNLSRFNASLYKTCIDNESRRDSFSLHLLDNADSLVELTRFSVDFN